MYDRLLVKKIPHSIFFRMASLAISGTNFDDLSTLIIASHALKPLPKFHVDLSEKVHCNQLCAEHE
jgi:hypothetical protein